MATVKDILAVKGEKVFTIDDKATVFEATIRMNLHKIGGLVVINNQGNVDGIFTERDVLSRVVAERKDPAATSVADVMTKDVICVVKDTPLEDVQAILTNNHIRHLPVVSSEGKVIGMVSIGDINAHFAEKNEVEIHYLNDYIYGRV